MDVIAIATTGVLFVFGIPLVFLAVFVMFGALIEQWQTRGVSV